VIDHHLLGDGLVLLAMMLAPVLLAIPFVRKHIGRLGGVILGRLNRPRDFDRELRSCQGFSADNSCADLRRVEHLIATAWCRRLVNAATGSRTAYSTT
jgi:hypothetical protein